MAETERISLAAMDSDSEGGLRTRFAGVCRVPAELEFLPVVEGESICGRWISAVSRLLVRVAGVTGSVLSVPILLALGVVWVGMGGGVGGRWGRLGQIDWMVSWCQDLGVVQEYAGSRESI